MHTVEYVNRQFGMMRGLFDATAEDLTEEQVNSAPPGVANSIGAALLHLVGSEDAFVQQVILGRPMIWERDGWSDRIGVSRVPGRGDDWSELRGNTVTGRGSCVRASGARRDRRLSRRPHRR
ncbi:MAG: DinB family protein [Thermomicrobiales bacterium]